MNYTFDDINAEEQVSENFAFDSEERFDADLTLEEIDTPIKELKVIILSIDWEITPEILEKFQQEIKKLQELWKQDNIALAFLRILGSLGNYVKICQAAAHPDAVKLLYSVYNGLEKTIISKEMSNAAKVALVQEELRKYNLIRDTIKQANAQAAKRAVVAAQTGHAPPDKSASSDTQAEKPGAAAAAVEQGPSPAPGDLEVTPALAAAAEPDDQVGSLASTGLQASSREEELNLRLDSFFGDDEGAPATGPQIEAQGGVVPLPESRPLTEPEPQGPKNANIFDDLFSHNQTTPADDLLLQMHLPIDKTSRVAESETEHTAEEDSEVLSFAEPPDNEGYWAGQDEELSHRLDSFFGDDEEPEATATKQQIGEAEGVIPLPAKGPDFETRITDSELAVFSRLKEILAGIDTSISMEDDVDFSIAVRKASALQPDNMVVQMLLEALESRFTVIRETGSSTPENTARLCALCEIAAEVTTVSTPPDSRLTAIICDEMRKHIAFQDSVIKTLLANK
jgi:hypothetical protein